LISGWQLAIETVFLFSISFLSFFFWELPCSWVVTHCCPDIVEKKVKMNVEDNNAYHEWWYSFVLFQGKESIDRILEKLEVDGFREKDDFEKFSRLSIRRLGRLLPDARWVRHFLDVFNMVCCLQYQIWQVFFFYCNCLLFFCFCILHYDDFLKILWLDVFAWTTNYCHSWRLTTLKCVSIIVI